MDIVLSTPHQRFTFVLLRASYLAGMSPAFSHAAHYQVLKTKQRMGGLVGAPVAPHRGATPSFKDPSSTMHLILAHHTTVRTVRYTAVPEFTM